MDEETWDLWQRFLATTRGLAPEQQALLLDVFRRSDALFRAQEDCIAKLEARLEPHEERERRRQERVGKFLAFMEAMGPAMEEFSRALRARAAMAAQHESQQGEARP